jgi:hypothetical protein
MNRLLAVIAIIIFVSSVVDKSLADQNVEMVGSVDYWSSAKKIVLSENYAYLVAGGLVVFDISDPRNPEEVGYVEENKDPDELLIQDNYLYSTYFTPNKSPSSSLQIHDLSDPEDPVEVGFIYLAGRSHQLVVSGKYVYSIFGTEFLQIIDITSPSNPIEVMTYKDFPVRSLAAYENQIFICHEDYGLKILDVSDPINPKEVGACIFDGEVHCMTVSGEFVYLSTNSSEIKAINASDPANPVIAGVVKHNSSYSKMFVSGNRLVALDGNGDYVGSVHLFDISDPSNIVNHGAVAHGVFDFKISENLLFVAAGNEGFRIIDITNAKYRRLVGLQDNIRINGADIFDNYAALYTTSLYVRLIDMSDKENPFDMGSFKGIRGVNDLKKSGDYLFVLSTYKGLHIINISDPKNSFEECSLQLDSASKIRISDNFAYVDCKKIGKIVDISDPKNPAKIGSFELKVVEQGSIKEEPIIDIHSIKQSIADIYHLRKKRSELYSPNPKTIVRGNYAYVLSAHLDIYDLSDPATPVLAGVCYTSFPPQSIKFIDNFAFLKTYVSGYVSGLIVVNITDPANPDIVGGHPGYSSVYKSTLHESFIYLTGRGKGLKVLDISNPYSPREAAIVPSIENDNFLFSDKYLFTWDHYSFNIYDHSKLIEESQAILDFLPKEFLMECSYQNHLEKTVSITITQPLSSVLKIAIYNLSGEEVQVFGHRRPKPGILNYIFDGSALPSGIYIIKATTPGHDTRIEKVVLMNGSPTINE